MPPATVSLPWVNRGEPFLFNLGRLTPATQHKALVLKAHELKQTFAGTGEMPAEIVRELRDAALREAERRYMAVVLHEILSQADPALKGLSPDEVYAKVTVDDWNQLFPALNLKTEKKETTGDPSTRAQS